MSLSGNRLQPINDRVYFSKWYLKGIRSSPTRSGTFVHKFVNLNLRLYLKFLEWMPAALKMPEPELIDHAGLDSAVFLRIYLIGLKIFIPITILAFSVLVPVNWTNGTLNDSNNLQYSDIDKLSISNVPEQSQRFWVHLVMAYVFTFWTCYVLRKEYGTIASMRLHFLATVKRRPDQFTVIVRNVPPDPDESVSELVEHFFLVNHRDHYLTHQVVYNANTLAKLVKEKKQMENWLDYYQLKFDRNPSKRPTRKTGFLGLCGDEVDAIDFYTSKVDKLSEEEAAEREKIIKNPKFIMPAAFVSFRTRWGAAVCAQTQQTRNPTLWLTEWAPEPRDSLANIEGIEKAVPFLKPLIEVPVIKSFIQALQRRSASRYYLFLLVNVFLGSIIAGTAFEQLKTFIHQSANDIPKTIGVSIPMKATFFVTYIMVDGWAGIAGEILMLKPLIIYHLKNFFLVKTEKDREEAMDPGSIEFATSEPQIQLYFLLGLVYATITPFLLPFILVFFGLAYVVFRHQIINVYNQEYESAAAFWPDVHGRIISALVISQLLLLGLLSTKQAADSTPFLIALPILTIWFHRFCKNRYEPAFVKYPIQEAMMKDTLERAREPNLDLKTYLSNAYAHPVFKDGEDEDSVATDDEKEVENVLVPTKRASRRNTPVPSKFGCSSPPSLPDDVQELL
ncbi:hypothetical protein OPV22_033391 [Ensete ventricosum]|uniref:CSC1/OSCA1-like 7TM region domain-containing protein n=2 Tax=Ensete ventricosum TaxID=4639 RepID=A0AAV8P283_ENSVE|nr:hypothetical protein OPV22_033391 [Ensete ventricosum]